MIGGFSIISKNTLGLKGIWLFLSFSFRIRFMSHSLRFSPESVIYLKVWQILSKNRRIILYCSNEINNYYRNLHRNLLQKNRKRKLKMEIKRRNFNKDLIQILRETTLIINTWVKVSYNWLPLSSKFSIKPKNMHLIYSLEDHSLLTTWIIKSPRQIFTSDIMS